MGGGEGTRERGKEGARERGSKRERKSERAREGCGEDTRVAELSHPSESCVKILWPISQQCVQKAREMLQASCPLNVCSLLQRIMVTIESSGCVGTYRSNLGDENELPLEDKGSPG